MAPKTTHTPQNCVINGLGPYRWSLNKMNRIYVEITYQFLQEITKRAGEKWNSMSEEEKAPYVAQAQETRLKWEKQLQIYKHELKIGVCQFHL